MPTYFPIEQIKPVALRAWSLFGGIPESSQTRVYANQSEWELVLEDFLWRAGRDGVVIPGDLVTDITALDPNFFSVFERGARVAAK